MMDLRTEAVAIGIALVGAFVGGMAVNGWRLGNKLESIRADYAQRSAKTAADTLAHQQALDETAAQLRQRIATIDQQESQQLRAANAETERLRTCIANGTCGLRVRTICPGAPAAVSQTGASASVGDGEWAALDPSARPAYLALRDGLDRKERQLAACQAILTAERQ